MWNPELDTISFNRIWGTSPIFFFDLIFPVETKQVRYLAVSSSLWSDHENHLWDTSYLCEFESLRRLSVVVDIPHEYELANTVRIR